MFLEDDAGPRQDVKGQWLQREAHFIENCWKMCPNCGAILRVTAKGCDNCLFQFDKSNYGLRRKDGE